MNKKDREILTELNRNISALVEAIREQNELSNRVVDEIGGDLAILKAKTDRLDKRVSLLTDEGEYEPPMLQEDLMEYLG